MNSGGITALIPVLIWPIFAQPSIMREYAVPGELAVVQYNTAIQLLRAGEYTEAFEKLKTCSDISRRGNLHDEAAGVLCLRSAAWVLLLEGKIDEAGRLQESTGEAYPDQGELPLSRTLERVELLRAAGRPDEARALASRVQVNNSGNPVIAHSRQLLIAIAELALEAGQTQTSGLLLDQARRSGWNQKKPEDVVVRGRLERATCKLNLALGKPKEAEAAARAALELHGKVLAEQTWDVLMDRFALADAMRPQARHSEAAALYQQVFQGLVKSLGPGQPDARVVLTRLAEVVKEHGQPADYQRIQDSLAGLPVLPCKMCRPAR